MKELLSRWGWFVVAALVVAYVASLILGSITSARAAGIGAPIIVRDEWHDNTHQLSGTVVVGSSCDEVSVRTQALSQSTYEIVLKTRQEASVPCDNNPTPRAFHTLVVGPAVGLNFLLTLDGRTIPITLVRLDTQ